MAEVVCSGQAESELYSLVNGTLGVLGLKQVKNPGTIVQRGIRKIITTIISFGNEEQIVSLDSYPVGQPQCFNHASRFCTLTTLTSVLYAYAGHSLVWTNW